MRGIFKIIACIAKGGENYQESELQCTIRDRFVALGCFHGEFQLSLFSEGGEGEGPGGCQAPPQRWRPSVKL